MEIPRRDADCGCHHGGIESRIADAAIDVSERAPAYGGLRERRSLRDVCRPGLEGKRQNVEYLRRQVGGALLASFAGVLHERSDHVRGDASHPWTDRARHGAM